MDYYENSIHFSKTIVCHECGAKKLCIRHILDSKEKEKLNFFTKKNHIFFKGEQLFQAGKSFQNLYFLRSGSAKSFLTAKNGNEQIINFHFPGEIIGLDNLTDNQYFSSTIFLEKAYVCKINKNSFNELGCEIPHFRHEVFSRLAKETNHLSKLLLSINHQTAEQNLATFILDLSIRMELMGLSKDSFRLSMSRKDIANYLGLASETISRLFKRFERDQLITIKNKNLNIISLQGLQNKTHDCDICSKQYFQKTPDII